VIDYDLGKELALARVTLETDALWLLPAALFECGFYRMESLFPYIQTAGDVSRKCVLAYPELANAGFKLIQRVVTKTHNSCQSSAKCNTARLNWLARISVKIASSAAVCLPLWRRDWDIGGSFSSKLCSVCREYGRAVFERERKDIWDRLPRMYGLASWDQLKKLKAAEFEDVG